jgi:hypothetical protein
MSHRTGLDIRNNLNEFSNNVRLIYTEFTSDFKNTVNLGWKLEL